MTTSALPAAALVEKALLSVEADPGRAERLASAALDEAEATGDHAVASAAERALGLARREVHDLDGAWRHLQAAVRRAADHGLQAGAGLAHMSLAGVLAYRGDFQEALQEAQVAADLLDGGDRAEAVLQCGNVLLALGRSQEALERYRLALPGLRRNGDRLSQARLHNNRGLLLIDLGRCKEAEDDLLRSEQLYGELGQDRSTAHVRSHLGTVALRRGDLPTALGWLERSDADCATLGITDLFGLVDRCPALLSARLASEARTALTTAIGALEGEGMATYVADARLLLAEVALLEGRLDSARQDATSAMVLFRRQQRRPHLARAAALRLRVDFARGERSPALLATARRTARALERDGWAVDALDARITAARIALDLGRRTVARHELSNASAADKGPVQVRSRAWHARALLRLAAGDRRGAERALRAGLAVLDQHRASLGATELRAHAAGHGSDLAEMGLRLAIAEGRPARVLAWAERWRAAALLLPPVRPPDDAELADLLSQLRGVVTEAEAATLAGRDAGRLRHRQARLEETVRRRARLAPGADSGPVSLPTVPGLLDALGDRAMVELVQVDDELHAVVVAGRRARLHPLGPAAAVTAELEALRFALRRLALRRGSSRAREAATAALAVAAGRLDALLLQPLEADLEGRPLVMVPTGLLHAMPWAVLPSCLGRPLVVAPSAAVWLRAVGAVGPRPEGGGHTVLVAGQGLPHAEAEVIALGRQLPNAVCLTGGGAAVAAVARALDGAGLSHIAAHGSFRSDNPLFSCLSLADGPLTVYDLEALDQAPATLVLSSCDVGLSSVSPGDELTGMASALLSLGTRSVVASVAPVADEATAALMTDFHQNLQSGEPIAEALARAHLGSDDPAAAFVCFGAG